MEGDKEGGSSMRRYGPSYWSHAVDRPRFSWGRIIVSTAEWVFLGGPCVVPRYALRSLRMSPPTFFASSPFFVFPSHQCKFPLQYISVCATLSTVPSPCNIFPGVSVYATLYSTSAPPFNVGFFCQALTFARLSA